MVEATTATKVLGIDVPIIQAPMAGATTAEMVVAVSNAGGLGSFGAAYTDPARLREVIRDIRAGTDRPFNINLFVPDDTSYDDAGLAAANANLAPIRAVLGIGGGLNRPTAPTWFDDQVEVLIEERVPVFSFHFGMPRPDQMTRAKAAGMTLLGSATTPQAAGALAAEGVDVIIAQGIEAGGHQGTFLDTDTPAEIGLFSLLPQIADAVSVPVVAAGGIMTGQAIAAALRLGAGAAQLGTAFLVCDESGAPDLHKQAVLAAEPGDTRLTRAFSGRPARGFANRFMDEVGAGALLPFPYQNSLTTDIRAAAAKQGRPEFMSLWAGQGAPLARPMPAAALIATLVAELDQ